MDRLNFRLCTKQSTVTTCVIAGLLILSIGITTCLIPISPFFHPEQTEVLFEIQAEITAANSSNNVTNALSHITSAVDRLDQYLTVHPLTNKSETDFQSWYSRFLLVKHQLNLATQIENSTPDPFKKLVAEDIALKSLKSLNELQLRNSIGAYIDSPPNVPGSIPIKLSTIEQIVTNCLPLLIPAGITAVIFGISIELTVNEPEPNN